MARRKEPSIPDAILDQLLAGAAGWIASCVGACSPGSSHVPSETNRSASSGRCRARHSCRSCCASPPAAFMCSVSTTITGNPSACNSCSQGDKACASSPTRVKRCGVGLQRRGDRRRLRRSLAVLRQPHGHAPPLAATDDNIRQLILDL